MPATRLLILPSAGWPIDFNRNLNAFKLGLMVQKFVQIGAKVRAALQKPYPFQKAILLRWFAILQAYFLNGYKGLYKLEAV